MGDIVRRATRDKPKYYGRYFESDGRRKMRLLKGARTKAEAQILLASAELRVSQGQVGTVPLEESQRCGPLMDEWLAGLSNRNAADDRSRFRLHARSQFADTDIDELQSIAPVMAWIDKQRQNGVAHVRPALKPGRPGLRGWNAPRAKPSTGLECPWCW